MTSVSKPPRCGTRVRDAGFDPKGPWMDGDRRGWLIVVYVPTVLRLVNQRPNDRKLKNISIVPAILILYEGSNIPSK